MSKMVTYRRMFRLDQFDIESPAATPGRNTSASTHSAIESDAVVAIREPLVRRPDGDVTAIRSMHRRISQDVSIHAVFTPLAYPINRHYQL